MISCSVCSKSLFTNVFETTKELNILSGPYVGIGASTTHTSVNSKNVIYEAVSYENFKTNTSNFAPKAQLGYWAETSSKVLWGVNISYSY